MKIREADISDKSSIRDVHMAAFDENERTLIADLAGELLQQQSKHAILNLVATIDEGILGHVAFSPIKSKSEDKEIAYILAPLAVHPESQNSGTGSKLVKKGLEILQTRSVETVLVYGDPVFYGRFGFKAELGKHFIPKFKLEHAFGWQAVAFTKRELTETTHIVCVDALNKPELW